MCPLPSPPPLPHMHSKALTSGWLVGFLLKMKMNASHVSLPLQSMPVAEMLAICAGRPQSTRRPGRHSAQDAQTVAEMLQFRAEKAAAENMKIELLKLKDIEIGALRQSLEDRSKALGNNCATFESGKSDGALPLVRSHRGQTLQRMPRMICPFRGLDAWEQLKMRRLFCQYGGCQA